MPPVSLLVDGINRPIMNADGRRIAPTDDATVDFWRWFGASEIVDGQGRPRVVYHGTDVAFTAFDPDHGIGGGSWFTPDREAVGQYAWGGRGQQVIPVYLRATRVIPFDAETTEPGHMARAGRLHATRDATRSTAAARVLPDGSIGSYVVYDARQIKSALHNTGAFASESPTITA